MGRATWDSQPEKFRPLPGRRNIVLTRNEKWRADGAEPVASVAAALALVGENETWVMGGGEIYRQFLPFARRCEVTDRKSTRLNSSHVAISYAVFCLKKKNTTSTTRRRAVT